MYILDTWRFKNATEYEYKYPGNYGAKGEKRHKRRKATPEEIKKNNQRNKSKRVRRLILANFSEGDYWITLTYPKDTARTIEETYHDLTLFLRRLRRAYSKRDSPLKFIYRIEIGSRGGIHVHILINRIEGLDQIVSDNWEHGHANIELLNEDPDSADKLADYITKPPTDQQLKIINSIADGDESKIIKYSDSRNLIRPSPESEEVKRGTMRRIFNNDLKPTDGYYIIRESITKGINPYTGMSYLRYSEYRLTDKVKAKFKGQLHPPDDPVKLCECPICHQLTLDFFACDCQRAKRVVKRGKRRG